MYQNFNRYDFSDEKVIAMLAMIKPNICMRNTHSLLALVWLKTLLKCANPAKKIIISKFVALAAPKICHSSNLVTSNLRVTPYWSQGCMSRTSVGPPAIETPPPPQAKILQLKPPPSGRKKIPFYLVLKGSKIFFGAFGAEKHPYTLYFRVLLRFYAL